MQRSLREAVLACPTSLLFAQDFRFIPQLKTEQILVSDFFPSLTGSRTEIETFLEINHFLIYSWAFIHFIFVLIHSLGNVAVRGLHTHINSKLIFSLVKGLRMIPRGHVLQGSCLNTHCH